MRYSLKLGVLLLFCLACSSVRAGERHETGLFVTVIDKTPVLTSREEILRLIDFAKQSHIGLLFVQIYRANETWFPSKVGNPRNYDKAFKSIGEDPLALLIQEAHAAGIKVHAWLNLLSLAKNKDAWILKKYGESILTKDSTEKKRFEDYKIDEQYFLEPGDLRVRDELALMVEEVLQRYKNLDGIQFDYIRYPDVNPSYGYTPMNQDRFKKAVGISAIEEKDPKWQDWKRAQVTELLKQLVKKVRILRPGMQVSTTGCAPYARAYYEAFQDWPSWVNQGLVDFVTLMTYPDEISEFEKDIMIAQKRVPVFKRVNVAVGAYKFAQDPRRLTRAMNICRGSQAGACVVFHYGSLTGSPLLKQALSSAKP